MGRFRQHLSPNTWRHCYRFGRPFNAPVYVTETRDTSVMLQSVCKQFLAGRNMYGMCYFLPLEVYNSQWLIPQEHVYAGSKSSLEHQGVKQCFE